MNDIHNGGSVLSFGKVKGRWSLDSRISLSVLYFEDETEAKKIAKAVVKQDCRYNGGWFDGMPCGRSEALDHEDNNGIKWYAVTC
jgi:hypothetical protein